jgi:hypothetical protein
VDAAAVFNHNCESLLEKLNALLEKVKGFDFKASLMFAMPEIRSFPRTRSEPRKRILLIPIFLIVLGYLMLIEWWIFGLFPLQFIGAILSLTGVMTIFLVGMVFADLWAAHRRTKDIIKAREEKGLPTEEDEDLFEDPFEETLDGD